MTFAQGSSGRLLAGGRVAARLGPWELEATPGGAVVTFARDPGFVDAYLSTRPALDLVLDLGRQRWRWRGVTWSSDQREIGLREKPEVIA